MKYYVAAPYGADRRDYYIAKGLGLLFSPTYGILPRPCEDWQFVLDNGAYSAYSNNIPWEEERFYSYVKRLVDNNLTPMFVVLPDIVAGGIQSLNRSVTHIPRLPEAWEKYLPVQDGMVDEDVIPILEQVDGIFVGGTVVWKWRTAERWCHLAHTFGLKCHIGRVNSERQLLSAKNVGADSVDGSSASRNHTTNRLFRHLTALQEQEIIT